MIAEDQKLYIFELLPKDNEFFETQGVRLGTNGKEHFVAPIPRSRYLLPGEKDDLPKSGATKFRKPSQETKKNNVCLERIAAVAYNNVQADYDRRTGMGNDIRLFKDLPITVQTAWLYAMSKVLELINTND
jgi:hypothetical protein